MTENHQGRFHASHVQTAPLKGACLQYSKIRNFLSSPDRKEELYAKIFWDYHLSGPGDQESRERIRTSLYPGCCVVVE